VSELVRFAVGEQLGLLPVGSRSKCDLGMTPNRYDIAVDMTGLREVAHYDAGDLTLSVDAGMPLRELETLLGRHGQFLPLAVPCFETTTAGGAIASGIDSVLRKQYGTARDFLIGAEFVDGTGQLCKSGGRVVKNVTGYDLHKMLIGSLGTLGIITRLNFRTFPLAAASRGHVANFAKSADALEYWRTLEKTGVPLANLEIVSPEAIKMIRAILQQGQQHVPAALEDGVWCVYSSYEGTEAVVRRVSGDLEKIAAKAGARGNEILEPAADELCGGMLREAFEWLRWGAPATAILRLALPEVRVELIAELTRLADSVSLRSALLVRAAGVVYFALFCESEEAALAPFERICPPVASVARSRGGYATLLHAPWPTKAKLAEANAEKMNLPLQQRVKKAFDPSGVFAPGRVVGGL
jgi:glycolate oxidase FAD binding subunit